MIDSITRAITSGLRIEKQKASDPWARQYRRAELVLDAFRGFLADQNAKPAELSPPDVLDRGIRTKRSLEEAKAASSPISKRWNIVTDLQTQDFADALRGRVQGVREFLQAIDRAWPAPRTAKIELRVIASAVIETHGDVAQRSGGTS